MISTADRLTRPRPVRKVRGAELPVPPPVDSMQEEIARRSAHKAMQAAEQLRREAARVARNRLIAKFLAGLGIAVAAALILRAVA